MKNVINFFKLKKKLFFAHSMHNFTRVSSIIAIIREISWSNSKKTTWPMSGGKDRQTLFHRILPAIARGLTLTTPIDCHLKVKDKKSNIGLIKIYCITVSMQKISPIHKLIQQILGSHELNDHAHFRPGPTFTFLKFAPTCQKSVHCINSFLRYSQF